MGAKRMKKIVAFLVGLTATLAAHAGTLVVAVLDRDGKPIPEAVISVIVPKHGVKPPAAPAVMSQKNLLFSPYVLPIMAGTQVVFPNEDKLPHHLKTASQQYAFEFPVYDPGKTPAPVTFDVPGMAILYCYFHGWMRAYVYVVDTPFFAKTDANGVARIENVPDGNFEVRAWHPDMSLATPFLSTKLQIGTAAAHEFKFDHRPRAKPTPRPQPAGSMRDY
jgi:plastocyanin